jgi:type VI secretion system secreted protein Hcp
MVDMYLNIDGIKGESTDDKHKDWIQLLSYSHGMSMPVSSTKSSAGGATTGRTQHGDFSVTKYIDLASPGLAGAVTSGKHIDKVIFEMCRAGGSQVPFMTVTMGQVIVSKVQHNGPQNVGGGGDAENNPGAGVGTGTSTSLAASNADVLPTETVSLNYGTIEWKYTQQKRTDGSGGGSTSTKADLTKGTSA